MRTKLAITITLLGLWAIPAQASGATIPQLFEQANQTLAADGPKAAWLKYEQLWGEFGVDKPALYYNAGIAATRGEMLGSAVWCFEKALSMNPDRQLTQDSERNLEIVRGLLRERLRLKGSAKQVAFILTPDPLGDLKESHALTILPWIALLLGLVGSIRIGWNSGGRSKSNWIGAMALILFIGGMGVTWFLQWEYTPRNLGVVTSENNPLREGSHETANILPVQVEEGQMVLLIDEAHPEFVRVELPNGKHGWLERAHVKEI